MTKKIILVISLTFGFYFIYMNFSNKSYSNDERITTQSNESGKNLSNVTKLKSKLKKY